jgi:hypothetical protein
MKGIVRIWGLALLAGVHALSVFSDCVDWSEHGVSEY